MTWTIRNTVKNLRLRSPILVEGLPGIGNIGKVAVDFIIDELGAKKLCEFESYSYPHSVFVNERNLVELPSIEVYYKQMKNRQNDLMLLSGDVQPIDETSCYQFTEKVIDLFQQHNGKEIVTIGGIAMKQIPKKPKLYCTGNSQKLIKAYTAGTNMTSKLYGIVGPIMGVSGLLLGMAKKRNIPAVTLLAETYGHPMYLGINGAREVINVLNQKLGIKLNVTALDKEIKELENEIRGQDAIQKTLRLRKLKSQFGNDMSYIG